MYEPAILFMWASGVGDFTASRHGTRDTGRDDSGPVCGAVYKVVTSFFLHSAEQEAVSVDHPS